MQVYVWQRGTCDTKMDKSTITPNSSTKKSISTDQTIIFHCKICEYKGSKNGIQQHLRAKPDCSNHYTKKELGQLDIHLCQNCEYKGSSNGIYHHLKLNPDCSSKYSSWMLSIIKKKSSKSKKVNILLIILFFSSKVFD